MWSGLLVATVVGAACPRSWTGKRKTMVSWRIRFDAEHPMDITMSRVRLASDTCDRYFSYIKVNLLLYTCSLDPFEDGILLDTPLLCMHRYRRSFTDDEEECKRQGTTTPSVEEAWKQRRKKTELRSLQRPDVRRATRRPTLYSARTTGLHRTTGA